MKLSDFKFPSSARWWLGLLLSAGLPLRGAGETLLLSNAVVHSVSGQTLRQGAVLIQNGRISRVMDVSGAVDGSPASAGATVIDLQGQHLYPGLIAVDTVVGLTEIEAVRATQDAAEVGEYTPDVESWIALNPDSELIPVARANGIAHFEPVPEGGIVSGQSALVSMDGWTYEQMVFRKPVALHVRWPSMELDTTPKERLPDASKWKSLEDQAKERRAKLRDLSEFFEEAKSYARAKEAAAKGEAPSPKTVPAWEAMLPYVRRQLPLVIHADEVRQIRSAVAWAVSNHWDIVLAGGRDSWMLADLLATNKIPVVFEHVFTLPARANESYDVYFAAPAVLHRAGGRVAFSVGTGGFGASSARNLPYMASQAIAFGLPEAEALKGITLYPAQFLGVADRLGSIEAGKDATLFVSSGDIFDIRSQVMRMWIAGREVSLESRHTRLYEKYRNRPRPR